MQTRELEPADVARPSPESEELFNSIMSECSRTACLEDAEATIRIRFPRGPAEPEVLGTLAFVIRCERKKKLDLHRQWIQVWARSMRRERELRDVCRRIAAGDGDARELAGDVLKATEKDDG